MPTGVYKRKKGLRKLTINAPKNDENPKKVQKSAAQKMHIDEESGATSSHLAPRFDLMPPNGFRVAARNWTAGAKIHKLYNWRQGISSQGFISDRINHMYEHLHAFVHPRKTEKLPYPTSVDALESHLGALIWGAMFLSEVLNHEQGKEALFQVLDITE